MHAAGVLDFESLKSQLPVDDKIDLAAAARGGDGSSRTEWTTVSSSGIRWISSITTVPVPGEPASNSLRRSGRALRLRCKAGSSRSRNSEPGSWSRNHVDLPVPRGPNRKQLCSGSLQNRLIKSILRLKVETIGPIMLHRGLQINRKTTSEIACAAASESRSRSRVQKMSAEVSRTIITTRSIRRLSAH